MTLDARAPFLAAGLFLLISAQPAVSAEARPLRRGDAVNSTRRGRVLNQYDFHEVVISINPRRVPLENPYTDLELEVDYESLGPLNKYRTTVRGFYYGGNQYRARCLLLRQGRLSYSARIKRSGTTAELTFQGLVNVQGESRDASKGPLAVSHVNPIWFEDHNGNPIFLSGAWSHGSLDINVITGSGGGKWGDTSPANFNRFALSAIRNGYLKQDGSPTPRYFKEVEAWIDDLLQHRINWIVITADHMGWGFQTASNWKGLMADQFNDPWRYDPNAGLIWDHTLQYARRKGLYVKINLQEFCQGDYAYHPMNHIQGVNLRQKREHPDDMVLKPEARRAWEAWVTYLVSRYSAFNNVHFQMGNEPPGDGCEIGGRWPGFDAKTQDLVQKTAGYPVLYSSGAPVGARGNGRSSYLTFHPTHEPFAASSYYREDVQLSKKPFHNEEIKAFNGTNLSEWLDGCRYVKFASFIAGGHGSALVMWNGGPWKKAMAGYKDSSVALYAFIEPVLSDLFSLKPDNSFIKTAPAKFARGLASEKHFLVYMQRRDVNADTKMVHFPEELVLNLPAGDYSVNWFDPITGAYLPAKNVTVRDAPLTLKPPQSYKDDFALRVTRR